MENESEKNKCAESSPSGAPLDESFELVTTKLDY